MLASLLLAGCRPQVDISALGGRGEADPLRRAPAAELRLELVGSLDSLSAEALTVSGTTFTIDPEAEVPDGLRTSQTVVVHAVVGAGGFAARAVRLAAGDQAPGLSFELIGQVESASPAAWIIGGRTVLVEAGTIIPSEAAAGAWVNARGSVGAGGALLANEFSIVPAPAEPDPSASPPDATSQPAPTAGALIEFTGAVTLIGPDTWTIGGRTVRVTSETEIGPGVTLGAMVSVKAEPQAPGSVPLARAILAAAGQPGTPPAP